MKTVATNHTLISAALAVLAVALILATGYRTYKDYSVATNEFDWEKRGLSDFHNGVYYPAMAFRDGVSPYSAGAMDLYPLTRPAPTYSPLVFILHLPFTLFECHIADVLFFLFCLAQLVLLAWCGIRMSRGASSWFALLGLTCLLLISRPGHITLFTGYFTLQLVLGTVLALHFARTRPVIAGIGMLLASGKPTYLIPLTILMLCRRDFKAVFIGILMTVIVAAVGLGWLASFSNFDQVVADIQSGQEALHDDETELPINTWTRLDLMGMAAKLAKTAPSDTQYLLGMLVLLVLPGIAIYRVADKECDKGAAGLTGSIVAIAMLVSIYHHSYDGLLLFVPWVGVTFYGKLKELSTGSRMVVSALTAVPAANYLSTQSVRDVLGLDQHSATWTAITLINGVCLLLALCILVVGALRFAKRNQQTTD